VNSLPEARHLHATADWLTLSDIPELKSSLGYSQRLHQVIPGLLVHMFARLYGRPPNSIENEEC
jgi:hypothetical protein